MNEIAQQRWFWLLIAGYLLLTVTYSVMNPLFEAPDEHNHFFTALYIAETGHLPEAGTEETELLHQEAAQPPLYYWLGSWLIKPLGLTVEGVGDDVWFNRFVQMGDPSSPTNLNRFVHTSAENWPWRGWVLAGQLLRTFSTLFGVATLLGIYACARLVWPNRPERSLLAVGLIAVLPQFNFLHSYVNNDVAIICVATWTLWHLIKLWHSAEPSWQRFIWLGVLTSLGLLSKMSGLILFGYVVGFIGFWAWRHGQWIKAIRGGLLMTATFAVLGCWLLVRNWLVYGDITALNRLLEVFGGDRGATLLEVFGETSSLLWSLLGVFGWFNVLAPNWVYALWIVAVLLAALGAAWQRPKWNWLAFLLGGWILAVYAGIVVFSLRAPGAQGRLLFPALMPLALAFSYGLSHWLGQRLWLFLAPAFVASLFITVRTLPQAYQTMEIVDTLPADVVLVEQHLTPEIELVAYQLHNNRVQPREIVWLDLYWRSSALVEVSPDIVLEFFGRDHASVGKLQTLHGGGLHPASLWATNTVFKSPIGIRLDKAITTPTQAKVNLRLVDGDALDLGFVKVGSAADFATYTKEPLARFGDGIALISAEIDATTVQPGETINIRVRWQISEDQPQTLSTLIHLGAGGAPPLAQGDSTPLQGDYPTHWWSAGEQFSDHYQVTLSADFPVGEYPLRIGFYDNNFIRLSASPDDGDQTYQLDMIIVQE